MAGPSSPVLFLKMNSADWAPVGEESLYAVVKGKNSTAAVVLCDGEGNSKAMSGWFPDAKAQEFANALASRGLAPFEGEVKLPI